MQKKRRDASIAYQVRMCVHLLGIKVARFQTIHYSNGLQLVFPNKDDKNASSLGQTVYLNTKTYLDRERLMEDLQESILEVTEMDQLRFEEISNIRFANTSFDCSNLVQQSSPKTNNSSSSIKYHKELFSKECDLNLSVPSANLPEFQRLSGDSGLLADMDTPNNQSSLDSNN